METVLDCDENLGYARCMANYVSCKAFMSSDLENAKRNLYNAKDSLTDSIKKIIDSKDGMIFSGDLLMIAILKRSLSLISAYEETNFRINICLKLF